MRFRPEHEAGGSPMVGGLTEGGEKLCRRQQPGAGGNRPIAGWQQREAGTQALVERRKILRRKIRRNHQDGLPGEGLREGVQDHRDMIRGRGGERNQQNARRGCGGGSWRR